MTAERSLSMKGRGEGKQLEDARRTCLACCLRDVVDSRRKTRQRLSGRRLPIGILKPPLRRDRDAELENSKADTSGGRYTILVAFSYNILSTQTVMITTSRSDNRGQGRPRELNGWQRSVTMTQAHVISFEASGGTGGTHFTSCSSKSLGTFIRSVLCMRLAIADPSWRARGALCSSALTR
jgi:hypothetical protein